MPVKIVFGKKSTAPASAPKSAQKPSEALKGVLPTKTAQKAPVAPSKADTKVHYDLSKAKKMFGFAILGAMSFDPPKEGRLFLIHNRKRGVWYEVKGHNPADGSLTLRSVHGTVFDGHTAHADVQFYTAVIGPEDKDAPHPDILLHIQGGDLD